MTVRVFLTAASGNSTPWARPTNWTDAGHIVDLIACGGHGSVGSNTSAANVAGAGGAGGGFVHLVYSSGALAATTVFQISNNNVSTTDSNTAGTFWQGNTAGSTQAYFALAGRAGTGVTAGIANSTGYANGASVASAAVVYTPSGAAGGNGGITTSGIARSGGGGGGGAAGLNAAKTGAAAGMIGGAGGATTFFGGGGGGGAGGTSSTVGAASVSATGGAGGAGPGGVAGGTAGSPGGAAAANSGGGGAGATFSITGNTSGGAGATGNTYYANAVNGSGGGGGGAGGSNTATTVIGGRGADFGGGGGGGGASRTGVLATTKAGGVGGGGLIAITYIPTWPQTNVFKATANPLLQKADTRASIYHLITSSLLTQKTVTPLPKIYTSFVKAMLQTAANTIHYPRVLAFLTTQKALSLLFQVIAGDPTVLLLHMDGTNGSTTFTDATGRHTAVVTLGTVTIDTSKSVFGGASAKFANNSQLAFQNNRADFQFGTGDYTIDGWWYFTDLTHFPTFLQWDMNGSGIGTDLDNVTYEVDNTGSIIFFVNDAPVSGLIFQSPAGVITTNAWYHVAFIRVSGIFRCFVNGIQVGTDVSDVNNFNLPTNDPYIGPVFGATDTWVDEFRVINGHAAYISNFTPPTVPYGFPTSGTSIQLRQPKTIVTKVFTADPTQALLHLNGTQGQGISGDGHIIDSTGNQLWDAFNSHTFFDSGQSKFGFPTAMKNNGSGGIYAYNANNVSAPLPSFSFYGDFTMDAWFYLTSYLSGENTLFDNNNWWVNLDSATGFLKWYGNSTTATTSAAVPLNQWNHIAVTRGSGTVQVFINGTSYASVVDNSIFTNTDTYPEIYSWIGWMQELRVVMGVAAWTSNFTPPTVPYVLGEGKVSLQEQKSKGAAGTFIATAKPLIQNAVAKISTFFPKATALFKNVVAATKTFSTTATAPLKKAVAIARTFPILATSLLQKAVAAIRNTSATSSNLRQSAVSVFKTFPGKATAPLQKAVATVKTFSTTATGLSQKAVAIVRTFSILATAPLQKAIASVRIYAATVQVNLTKALGKTNSFIVAATLLMTSGKAYIRSYNFPLTPTTLLNKAVAIARIFPTTATGLSQKALSTTKTFSTTATALLTKAITSVRVYTTSASSALTKAIGKTIISPAKAVLLLATQTIVGITQTPFAAVMSIAAQAKLSKALSKTNSFIAAAGASIATGKAYLRSLVSMATTTGLITLAKTYVRSYNFLVNLAGLSITKTLSVIRTFLIAATAIIQKQVNKFFLFYLLPNPPPSGSNIDLDFTTNQYYDSSIGMGVPLSNYLTCTRASVGYAKTSAGTLTQFANDTLRLTDLGLLIEDASTNYLPYSQDYTQWGKNESTDTMTGGFLAPDGTFTATRLIPSTSTNNGHGAVLSSAAGLGIGGNRTITFYARANGYSVVQTSLYGGGGSTTPPNVQFDLIAGTAVLQNSPVWTNVFYSIESYGGGWWRCTLGGTETGTPTFISLSIFIISGGSGNFIGDGVSGVDLWGAQVEVRDSRVLCGSSYIPTTTAPVTRAADAVTVIGNAAAIVQGSLTTAVLATTALQPATDNMRWLGADGGLCMLIGFGGDGRMYSYPDGNYLVAGSLPFGVPIKIAASWNTAGGRSLAVPGAPAVTDNYAPDNAAGPIVLSYPPYTWQNAQRLTLWNTRLDDTTLASLTVPGTGIGAIATALIAIVKTLGRGYNFVGTAIAQYTSQTLIGAHFYSAIASITTTSLAQKLVGFTRMALVRLAKAPPVAAAVLTAAAQAIVLLTIQLFRGNPSLVFNTNTVLTPILKQLNRTIGTFQATAVSLIQKALSAAKMFQTTATAPLQKAGAIARTFPATATAPLQKAGAIARTFSILAIAPLKKAVALVRTFPITATYILQKALATTRKFSATTTLLLLKAFPKTVGTFFTMASALIQKSTSKAWQFNMIGATTIQRAVNAFRAASITATTLIQRSLSKTSSFFTNVFALLTTQTIPGIRQYPFSAIFNITATSLIQKLVSISRLAIVRLARIPATMIVALIAIINASVTNPKIFPKAGQFSASLTSTLITARVYLRTLIGNISALAKSSVIKAQGVFLNFVAAFSQITGSAGQFLYPYMGILWGGGFTQTNFVFITAIKHGAQAKTLSFLAQIRSPLKKAIAQAATIFNITIANSITRLLAKYMLLTVTTGVLITQIKAFLRSYRFIATGVFILQKAIARSYGFTATVIAPLRKAIALSTKTALIATTALIQKAMGISRISGATVLMTSQRSALRSYSFVVGTILPLQKAIARSYGFIITTIAPFQKAILNTKTFITSARDLLQKTRTTVASSIFSTTITEALTVAHRIVIRGYSFLVTTGGIGVDYARSFNGVTDYITLPYGVTDALAGGSAVTVSCWYNGIDTFAFAQSTVRLQTSGSEYIVLTWQNGSQTTTPQALVSVDGATSGLAWPLTNLNTGLQDGNWHHLLMTWQQNATFALYHNGTLFASRTAVNVPLPAFSHGMQPHLGTYDTGGEFMHGAIADVAVWNTVLTPTQITQLASGIRASAIDATANLVLDMPMVGQSPEWDISGNAFNGVLTGTTIVAGPPSLQPWGMSGFVLERALLNVGIFSAAAVLSLFKIIAKSITTSGLLSALVTSSKAYLRSTNFTIMATGILQKALSVGKTFSITTTIVLQRVLPAIRTFSISTTLSLLKLLSRSTTFFANTVLSPVTTTRTLAEVLRFVGTTIAQVVAQSLAGSGQFFYSAVTSIAARTSLVRGMSKTAIFISSPFVIFIRKITKGAILATFATTALSTVSNAFLRGYRFAANTKVLLQKTFGTAKQFSITTRLSLSRMTGKSTINTITAVPTQIAHSLTKGAILVTTTALLQLQKAKAAVKTFSLTSTLLLSKRVGKSTINTITAVPTQIARNIIKTAILATFAATTALTTAGKAFLRTYTMAATTQLLIGTRQISRMIVFNLTAVGLGIGRNLQKTMIFIISELTAVSKKVGKSFVYGATTAFIQALLKAHTVGLSFIALANIVRSETIVKAMAFFTNAQTTILRSVLTSVLDFTVNISSWIVQVGSKNFVNLLFAIQAFAKHKHWRKDRLFPIATFQKTKSWIYSAMREANNQITAWFKKE